MRFYDIKQELIKLAGKLFTYTPRELDGDIDLNGKFDFIDYKIVGPVSHKPQELMEKSNLDYNRDEQGRDYFNSFLTIAIQCGVYLGHEEKEKEISDLKENIEFKTSLLDSYKNLIKELKLHQMGEGDLESQIIELRNKVSEQNKTINHLMIYKNAIDKLNKSIEND